MGIKVQWLVPAYYVTPSQDDVCFDLTLDTVSFLANKQSQCGPDHSLANGLQQTVAFELESLTISISGMPSGHIEGLSRPLSAGGLLRQFDYSSELAPLGWRRNYLLYELDYRSDIEVPSQHPNEYPDFDFVEFLHRQIALCKQCGAAFKAALLLKTFCKYPLMGGVHDPLQGSGLLRVESGGVRYSTPWASTLHTYPAILKADSLPAARAFMTELFHVWHLPLWPVHRYLNGLQTELVELEHTLDFLFALDGLFPNRVSADYIQLASALLLGANPKHMRQIQEHLAMAYRVRNDIAHGARSYSSSDEIKVSGKRVPHPEFFLWIREIVASMICLSIERLRLTPNARQLALPADFVIAKLADDRFRTRTS